MDLFTSKDTNKDKAFTLVEILVVLALFGLIFSLIAFSFHNVVRNSLNLIESGSKIKDNAIVFWDLQKAVLSAKDIYIQDEGENSVLYLITAGGLFEDGVVKASFYVKDGFLYYKEFPYNYGDIRYMDEGREYKIAKVENFKVRAFNGRREVLNFRGIPEYLIVEIDGYKFTIVPLK